MSSAPTAPTLTDGVVTLRHPRVPDDVQGSLEQSTDPLSQRWTTVPVPYSRADAEEFLGRIIPGGWERGEDWHFVVESDDGYLGTIALRPEVPGRAEIAYGAHPRARGTGLVERACRVLLDWGFAEQGLHTVVWWADRGNWASRKLAWRLGFTVEGGARSYLPQRGALNDAWLGTLLRDDPREPRTRWLVAPAREADGVRLRPLGPGDVPEIVAGCTDPRTRCWVPLPDPYGEPQALAYLESTTELHATGAALTWAVADAATDRLRGVLQVRAQGHGSADLGYWTLPTARGRGTMSTALRLALPAAVDTWDLHRLEATAAVANTASRHVLESAGFRLVGELRRGGQAVDDDGVPADGALYEVLAADLS